ncbi:MAG: glycosyltransferase family 2 protein [Candidatus Bathyarchaeia archaeon]
MYGLGLAYAFTACVFLTVLGYTLYNLPILAAGLADLKHQRRKRMIRADEALDSELPTFSIVVPAKNEEKVVGRLLEALMKVKYPPEKFEVIVVVDGSSDKTLEICRQYAEKTRGNFKVYCKPTSNGKPSALNYGVKHAAGEILAFFDADSVPEEDVLINVSKYFADRQVAAVQGRTFSINAEENMLTRFIAVEEAAWCEAYLRGKDALNLFVHLKGSCQFIRRNVLLQLGGFDEKALSEDMELSARLAGEGYRIRYASDTRAWQETPSRLSELFKQRVRWLTGTMQTALKYGRLMAKPNWKKLDAEVTLSAPAFLMASMACYLTGIAASLTRVETGLGYISQLITVAGTLTFMACGLTLMVYSKPRRLTNLLWLPFIYFYWSLQAFIAFYAALNLALNRPARWVKTDKTGKVTSIRLP